MADAQAVLAAYRTASFNLIITDFKMPDMEGVEPCRIVRVEAPGQKLFRYATLLESFVMFEQRGEHHRVYVR